MHIPGLPKSVVAGFVLLAASLSWAQTAVSSPSKPIAADARKTPGYSVEAVPRWVVPAREDLAAPAMAAPMHYPLIDDQVMVEGSKVWNYSRVVRKVGSVEGLATASQIEIEFDPSYQRLALHTLQLVREGKRIDKIDRRRIQLLQRESQLERRIYDGRMTMSIVLDDVRVGDRIELAYSTIGANPVFDGKLVQSNWMASGRGPVALYQLRLLAPASRPIRHKAFGSDVAIESTLQGAMRQTVFRRQGVEQIRLDSHAPLAAALRHQVQFSEFDDWADVVRWGRALFEAKGGELVDRQAEAIRGQTADREAQVVAALQFVQRDVRYFGTEIGAGSHRPAAPDKVLEQRFGDCKDKVALLIALLRRLGVEAVPVLVSSSLRSDVQRYQPGPFAFDHVIARVDLDGKAYWLDATRAHQTGTLANRQAVGFGKGLLLAAGAESLSDLPTGYDTERIVVRDLIRVDSFVAEPELTSRITYRGDLAEAVRAALAAGGLQDITNQAVAPYLRFYPKLRSVAALEIESSESDDALTLVQRFALPDFWRFPEERLLVADVANWLALDALTYPKSETRRDPLAINLPGVYRQSFAVEFAEEIGSKPSTQRADEGDAQVSLKTSFHAGTRRAEYSTDLRIAIDRIEAADWPAYTRRLDKLAPKLNFTLTVPAIPVARVQALTDEIKKTDEAIRAKRLKPVTRTQAEALGRALVLSAQIESGRLAPPLESQARVRRGIQYDHQGRFDLAQADFERAMALAPASSEARNAAATNAIARRELDRAIELSDAVLAAAPHDTQARNNRALARYLKNDLAGAQADFEELLNDSASLQRGYPVVWLSLTLRQAGKDIGALAQKLPKDQLPSDWPRPLIDMALGLGSEDAAIRAARDSKNPLESLSEAYFYVGEKYKADGQAERAREYWLKSVDQGVVEFVEHGAANVRLKSAKPPRS